MALSYAVWAKQQPRHRGEEAYGENTSKTPIFNTKLTFIDAFNHWRLNQGQPLVIPFSSIDFTKGRFSQSRFEHLLSQYNGKYGTHTLTVHGLNYEFKSERSLDEGLILGNITVDFEGTLTIMPNHRWIMSGYIRAGHPKEATWSPFFRGDIYNFNASRYRNAFAEALVAFTRNLCGTSFHIFLS